MFGTGAEVVLFAPEGAHESRRISQGVLFKKYIISFVFKKLHLNTNSDKESSLEFKHYAQYWQSGGVDCTYK